ncbi:MAG: DUF2284 domain-containing protein [Christensenellaceae bacterium]
MIKIEWGELIAMNEIEKSLIEFGAMHTAPLSPDKIHFYQEVRDLCAANSCGNYAKNWGCPPGCGQISELQQKIQSYQNGIVYQFITPLEDSFDYEGMLAAGKNFLLISTKARKAFPYAWVLGGGGCSLCETCTYPTAPCAHPDLRNTSVEACGINVSELCSAAGLDYIHGKNTVTNTGIVLY